MVSHIKMIEKKKKNKPFEKMNKPLQWFSLFFCMDKQANSCFSLHWLRQSRRPWIFDCLSIHVEMNINVQQLLVIHPIIQILLSPVKSRIILWASPWFSRSEKEYKMIWSSAPYAVSNIVKKKKTCWYSYIITMLTLA